MNRRQMCKLTGTGLGLLLVSVQLGSSGWWQGLGARTVPLAGEGGFTALSQEEGVMLRTLARTMLTDDERSLPLASLEQLVKGVDVAIAGLPLASQAELAQLFALLRSPLLMAAIAGGPWCSTWADAKPDEVGVWLEAWRFSRLGPLKAGYQALHELIMAAWYGQEASWAEISYPGPAWGR